jgi:two-component system cell cycle response regulator
MNSDASKTEILIVDDSKVVRLTAKKILRDDYAIFEATNGLEAWDVLLQNPNIAAVFCDLQMEGSDGYDLLELIRGSDDPRLLNLPVIIITGSDDNDGTKRKVLNLGATDFIVKPFDAFILKNRADAYIGYCQRLAEVEAKSEQDKLTGLANKRSFISHGEQDLSLAKRHKTELAVALIEVNHFTDIIEKYGKQNAAHILVELSRAIEETLRKEDISSRVGTARFGLILPLTNRVGSLRSIERLCEKIDSLAIDVDGETLKLSISAGVTVLDAEQPCPSFSQFVGEAKAALKKSMESGGGLVSNTINIAQPPSKAAPVEEAPVAEAPVAEAPTERRAPQRVTDQKVESIDIKQLITQIESGAGDAVDTRQLRQLMRSVLPLINYANERLDLGLGSSLEVANKRLKEEGER